MKLNPNREIPLHKQAEELLWELIESDEYKNGKMLPKEVELAQQLDISRNTLIVTVRREDRILSPRGSLTLETGDRLMVFDRREVAKEETGTQV